MEPPSKALVRTTEMTTQRAQQPMEGGQSPDETAHQLVQDTVSAEQAVQILAQLLQSWPVTASA
eukprot:4538363-Alexandrium_andersonii.AAC.1